MSASLLLKNDKQATESNVDMASILMGLPAADGETH